MFFGDQSGSYFCGFTFWTAPRHCAGAVRYSFCMSPAWVLKQRGARFSIGRSLFFFKNHFIWLFTLLATLFIYWVYFQVFEIIELNIMMFCCLNLVVLTSIWFVTCCFVLFKLVFSLCLIWVPFVLVCNCIKLYIIQCFFALTRGGIISLGIMKLWRCTSVIKVWAWFSWLQLGWLHVLHFISGSFNMMNTVFVGDFRAPTAPGPNSRFWATLWNSSF